MKNSHESILNEASSPQLESDREPSGPRHLTTSQASALRQLSDLYSLRGQPKRAGVAPRTVPLICGPSGVGKTSVVSRLCDLEGKDEPLPLLVILASSWCVFGSYTTPHSLDVVRAFVKKHNSGVIFLDEVEKALPHGNQTFTHHWSTSVLGEIISLTDAMNGDKKLSICGWLPAEIAKLSNFFLVGAGAWMSIYEKSSKAGKKKEYAQQIADSCGIPAELYLRFNRRLIEIKAPTKSDFRLAIRRIRSELELPTLSDADENTLGDVATASGYGLRWLETYLTGLLTSHPHTLAKQEKRENEVDDKVRISKSFHETMLSELRDLTESSQRPVYDLQVRLQRLVQIAKAAGTEKGHFKIEELQEVIEKLRRLGTGLQYWTSITEPQRVTRADDLIKSGEELLDIIDAWAIDRPFGMDKVGVLNLMIHVRTSISRVLDTWKLVTQVKPYDAA